MVEAQGTGPSCQRGGAPGAGTGQRSGAFPGKIKMLRIPGPPPWPPPAGDSSQLHPRARAGCTPANLPLCRGAARAGPRGGRGSVGGSGVALGRAAAWSLLCSSGSPRVLRGAWGGCPGSLPLLWVTIARGTRSLPQSRAPSHPPGMSPGRAACAPWSPATPRDTVRQPLAPTRPASAFPQLPLPRFIVSPGSALGCVASLLVVAVAGTPAPGSRAGHFLPGNVASAPSKPPVGHIPLSPASPSSALGRARGSSLHPL